MPDMVDAHLSDEDLHALLDGELDRARQRMLRSHLGSCPQCASRLERMRHLFTLIESVPDAAYEGDLAGAVLRSLAIRPIPRLAMLEAGLAAGLVLLASMWLTASDWAVGWAEDLQGWAGSVADRMAGLVAGLTAQLGGLLQGLTTATAPELVPGMPPIPATQLWLLAGSALLLWAVGNGLLLRRTGEERR